MTSDRIVSGIRCIVRNFVLCVLLLFLPGIVLGQVLGTSDIRVLGICTDVDTRPDAEGFQYTMTAVKNIPAAVDTFAGFPGEEALPVLSPDLVIRADLSGPGIEGIRTLSAVPNGQMELPVLKVPGEYLLSGVRLEDENGTVILERDPSLDPVVITVIDRLLVTQVTSRPLTAEEIAEKGIVIDEDSFTAMNFTVGLTVGSEAVVIDMPVLIPANPLEPATIPQASANFHFEPARTFTEINIPNLSLVGFSLRIPEEAETQSLDIPPVNGVIVIPGNIAFLNQFFSVILQAANTAPEGSGLVLENAAAAIVLPLGDDEIKGSGDDPLRVAETGAGVSEDLPLTDGSGNDSIVPQGTNQAEFLVEGLREGSHTVQFDIRGGLYIPSLGKTVPMTGSAAGLVQVKNPTFSMTLAHPDVVRDGEEYSLFATVTNTSSSPANFFQLNLSTRSLSGARLADGENELKTLDTLLPGQAETFEYRLVALTTGQVTGTVFLADEGINGSFILKTGVGDTGIPLSPDTLVLPQTTDYLPDDPDLVFAAVRLLGQAYSVATAPAGALPDDISRMSKSFVFDRAVKLAQAGLHIRFGEDTEAAVQDILTAYFGSDLGRLASLYTDEREKNAVESDMRAFDGLRRMADAGQDFSRVLGELLGESLSGKSIGDFQEEWAKRFASRPPHLSFGVSSPSPVYLRMSDREGNILGRTDEGDTVREISFADRLVLSDTEEDHAEILFSAAPESEEYTFALIFPESVSGEKITAEISMVLPDGEGMKQVKYSAVTLPPGSIGKAVYSMNGGSLPVFTFDTDGDGTVNQTLSAVSVTAIPDIPPSLIRVMQWAKGDRPATSFDFATGDPLGRMIGVLFSEEVTKDSATLAENYGMTVHHIGQISFQPDRRMVFLMTEEPAGSFIPRNLTVSGIKDMRGNALVSDALELTGSEERGEAGVVSGTVQGPDGTPVSFAQIRYIQPVFNPPDPEEWTKDLVISEITADASGRYQIEFVLKNGNKAEEADIWLNERYASGTDNFKLDATDPLTGDVGRASSRIRYDGQHMVVNIIIRGYGRIEGTIYDEDGNIVSGGAPGLLPVLANNTSMGESCVSWADESGQYSFPQVYIAADGTEYAAPRPLVGNTVLRVALAGDQGYYTGVATVNIPAAEVTVSQDIVLIPSSRFGTVTGRVLEGDGATGAPGVLVQVQGQVLTALNLYDREYEAGIVGSMHTDENGFFQFENVPAGDIEVRAFRQSTCEQARAAAFLAEEEEKHLTLILPGSGGTVRGYVRDALGSPVAGGKVAGGSTLTETDENGYFEISGLPLGSVTVYAQAADSAALGTVQADIVSADDILDVLIKLEAVGSIQGTVYNAAGETVSGQKVQLWVGDQGVMAETYTDEDGNYRFENYPVNQYTLKAVEKDYGDGGMALTAIRCAGDTQDADIRFRGMGGIRGRVIQDNGTPVITDVIITRKVWRIIPETSGTADNYYLEYVNKLQEQADEGVSQEIGNILNETGVTAAPKVFFMLVDEPVLLSSDITGPGGEVTGEFDFTGPVTGGPFTVSAFGPFLAPAEVSGEIPNTTVSEERNVDVGDIVLEAAVGEVSGTVFMPDGESPAGENIIVRIRSLDSSGNVRLPENFGGSVSQPVLPEYSVSTDENGKFHFPLVLRGRFVLTADTGVPAPAPEGPGTAASVQDMQTENFYDRECEADDAQCISERIRVLNVRLYGRSNGVVPAGGETEIGIRLSDVAGVRVNVVENNGETPVPYANVSLTTASDLDGESEYSGQTDAEGFIDFFPVIEGNFSVSAKIQGSPVTGRASGSIPENPSDGYEKPVTVTLGAVTTGSGQVVSSAVFGTVSITVFKADGSLLENPAQVTVKASGVSILAEREDSGTYLAESVPGGAFRVDVFEPFTARRGTSCSSIANDGDTVNVPVTLVGLGTVNGHALSADGSRNISSADVILYPSGTFTDPLISRSDDRGSYSLPGVPLGTYTVEAKDCESGLGGSAQGTMAGDGDTVTTDVYLEPAGSVTGIVYGPGVILNGQGEPLDENGLVWTEAPVAADAEVSIKKSGFSRTVRTGTDGRFTSGPYLPMGTYTLTAVPLSGTDGTSGSITLTYEGEEAETAMALKGSGSVRGYVLDSFCSSPVAQAGVTLSSESPYSPGPVSRFTDENGEFLFENIPVGEFSVSVSTTSGDISLGAAAIGQMEYHGQVFVFAGDDAVCLQDSGNVTGTVMFSDAAGPAEGAVAEIRMGNLRLVRLAGASGEFAFEGLPLGTWTLSVREAVSNGVAGRTVLLEINGQNINLGTIILDDRAPVIETTVPKADATDVNPADPVVITFSEAIDPSSVSSGTFRVTADGAVLEGTCSVSGNTVTFVPAARFPDLKRISILLKGDSTGFEGQILESGIRDTAGLGMVSDFSFSFSTGDFTPPVLKSISPADGAPEVSLNSVIRVEFSEPVNRDTVSLSLETGGSPVAGTMNAEAVFGDQVFIFTPEENLLPDSSYSIVLAGSVSDLAGNPAADQQITAVFSTVDTLAPSVNLAYSGTLVHGNTISIEAVSQDPDTAWAEFCIGGQLAATVSEPPYIYLLYLDPDLGTGIRVEAVITDEAGNRSSISGLDLAVEENGAPDVSLSLVTPLGNSMVNQGEAVTVRVNAADDTGLAGISFTAGSGSVFSRQENVSGTLYEKDFTFTVPADAPAGSSLVLAAVATDTFAQNSSSELSLTVMDQSAPSVTIVSPGSSSTVDPGSTVSVTVRADDTGGIGRIGLSIGGTGSLDRDTLSFDPAITPASATFVLTVPADALPSQPPVLQASAEDSFGNTGYSVPVTLKISESVHVESVSPPDSSVNISVIPDINVIFTGPLDPATITETSFTVSEGGIPVAGTRIMTEGNTGILWIPDAALSFSTLYTVEISDAVKDTAGKAVSSFISVFTVTDFAIISPQGNETVTEGQSLAVRSGGSNTSGIGAVDYRADGTEIGTGSGPAPYETEWNIPVTGTEKMTEISAEAVAGGRNLSLTAGEINASAGSYDYGFPPSRAADGDTDAGFSGGSVAAVIGSGDSPGWWQADLGKIFRIGRIVIHLQDECCSLNNRFAVLVATEPFTDSGFSTGAVEVYRTSGEYDTGVQEIMGPFIGRYVRVVHLGEDFLGLAEVEIFERESRIPVAPVNITVSPANP